MRNFLFLILTIICSCSTSQENEADHKKNGNDSSTTIKNTKDTVDEETGISPPVHISNPDDLKIILTQDTLYKGDTLKLEFKTPHPKDLAIMTPDGSFFFLVYAHDNKGGTKSLMDWNTFDNIDQLYIITDKTKADPWDARINENQIIFTKTGSYEIRMSENLETDDGTPMETKTIYYIHKPKRK
jgi:hypothetical protein